MISGTLRDAIGTDITVTRTIVQRKGLRIGFAANLSLPPGRDFTCVGASDFCDGAHRDKYGVMRKNCYAKRGFGSGNARVRDYRAYVYDISQTAAFVPTVVAELLSLIHI